MKIGLVSGEFPSMQGGVGDYTFELAKALAELGEEVHVITDVRCKGVETGKVILHPVIKRWSFPVLLTVRALAQRLGLDVLNIQYQAAAYGLSAPIHFLPKVAPCPTVVTFHDLRIPYLFPKAGRLREAAVTYLARSAAGVIVTDPADEAELKRRGGVRALTQIPIGSNIAPAPPQDYDRTAWRRAMNVGENDFLLGYFGFLNESKGGDTLISALALLHDRKARAKLVLIGGRTGSSDATNAAFDAQLERQIKRYGLENAIQRTGFVSPAEVSAHLLACDALVLPYRDGVSLRRGTLMAALAHGCAIISTTPRTPLPKIRDGENMRLVPPEDAPAIVLAVSQLLEAPHLRARLGEGARTLAEQFGWGRIGERTLKFFGATILGGV